MPWTELTEIFSINDSGTSLHFAPDAEMSWAYDPLPWRNPLQSSLVNIQALQGPAPCTLRGCNNRPAPFPGRMSYKATKPGLVSVLYLIMRYTLLLFIRAPLCMVSFCCYVFCLFVVLVKLSVLAKWLARKTPL